MDKLFFTFHGDYESVYVGKIVKSESKAFEPYDLVQLTSCQNEYIRIPDGLIYHDELLTFSRDSCVYRIDRRIELERAKHDKRIADLMAMRKYVMTVDCDGNM